MKPFVEEGNCSTVELPFQQKAIRIDHINIRGHGAKTPVGGFKPPL